MEELEYGFAGRPRPGEERSGDGWLAEPIPGGALIAVTDGLGHGPEASAATCQTLDALRAAPPNASLEALFLAGHRALLRTRGAALSLARIDTRSGHLTWEGVGNVEGLVIHHASLPRSRETLVVRGGVVGYEMPSLSPRTMKFGPGDWLVMATDGIRAGFADTVRTEEPVQKAAERILADFALPEDDALVVVVRRGGGRES